MKKQKAFTLIELMVVMAIIAILATAGIYAYSGYTKKARDTSRVEIGRTIESSVLGFMASNNGRAPTPTALKSALTNEGIEIKDPAGGGDMCLDDDGATANQPCRFDYVAYDDGSYSISYGVESPDSTKENFYQTTFNTTSGGTLKKVGVYRGSAPFVGAAVNTTYQPTLPDKSTLIAIPSNLDAEITTEDRLDTPKTTVAATTTAVPATTVATCGNGLVIGGYTTVIGEDGRCWFATNLSGAYQWMKKYPGWISGWAGDPEDPSYGDPCQEVDSRAQTPTNAEWIALDSALPTWPVTNNINLVLGTMFDSETGDPITLPQDSFYWSSSPDGSQLGYNANFSPWGLGSNNGNNRASGFLVRCIVKQ